MKDNKTLYMTIFLLFVVPIKLAIGSNCAAPYNAFTFTDAKYGNTITCSGCCSGYQVAAEKQQCVTDCNNYSAGASASTSSYEQSADESEQAVAEPMQEQEVVSDDAAVEETVEPEEQVRAAVTTFEQPVQEPTQDQATTAAVPQQDVTAAAGPTDQAAGPSEQAAGPSEQVAGPSEQAAGPQQQVAGIRNPAAIAGPNQGLGQLPPCQDIKQKIAFLTQMMEDTDVAPVKSDERGDEVFPGSYKFRSCVSMAVKNWADISEQSPEGPLHPGHWGKMWKNVHKAVSKVVDSVESKAANVCNSDGTEKNPHDAQKLRMKMSSGTYYKNIREQVKTSLKKLYKCAALAVTMSPTDYSDVELSRDKSKDASMDNAITCKSRGFITQDFAGCKKLVTAYNALLATEKIGKEVQNVQVGLKGQEIQQDVLEKQKKGNAMAAIEGQEEMVRERAGVAKVQAAFHTAKLATLAAMIKNIPDEEDVTAECEKGEGAGGGYFALIQNWRSRFGEYWPDELDDPSYVTPCSNITNIYRNLLLNQGAVEQAKSAMVQAGVDAAKMAAIGIILDKQADKISEVADKVQQFEPNINLGYGQEDLRVSMCQANPSAPECQGQNLDVQRGFGATNIAIEGMQRSGTGDYSVAPGAEEITGEEGASPSGESLPVGSMGSVATTEGRGSDFETTPTAPKVKNVSSKGGGGGVGGGGGGAGGGGGGGPGAAPKRARNAAGGAVVGKGSYAYGASGGSGYSYSGGKARKRAASKGNPFSKLFGKKKKGGTKVVNFRGLASIPKNIPLFELISDRYRSNRKNLINYEVTKSPKSK
ncbi:MAG: hypothetical protein ISR65_00390 [Bacteriovoracaceae bacterium]|nr:hypothetical protein [Bacteriovoracaceae bacterium]